MVPRAFFPRWLESVLRLSLSIEKKLRIDANAQMATLQ